MGWEQAIKLALTVAGVRALNVKLDADTRTVHILLNLHGRPAARDISFDELEAYLNGQIPAEIARRTG